MNSKTRQEIEFENKIFLSYSRLLLLILFELFFTAHGFICRF